MDLSLLDFGARYYDPYIARWTTQDPLAGKYYPLSPYNYCGNDPVNCIDPNGKKIYDSNGAVISYNPNNGWSSNADPKFVEIATLMLNYDTGTEIINSMLSSEIKYTVNFIDTLFPTKNNKMGQNEVKHICNDNGEVTSIISCDITISIKAIENRKENPELSNLEYAAGILAHEWGHGSVENSQMRGKDSEDNANIPKNNLLNEIIKKKPLPRVEWKQESIAHIL